jgi:radical SAM superfamily enzyme YgiQ (UPF0313 family)
LAIEKPTSIYMASGMTYWYPGVRLAIRILKEHFPGVPIILGGIYATLCFDHANRTSGATYVYRGNFFKSGQDDILPAYDLLKEKEMLPLNTSRGCPFHCTYCASGILNEHFVQRDPVDVFEELMHYRDRYGTKRFVFYDDALLYRPDSGIKKLLRMVMASGGGFRFYTPNGLHARFIDEELAYLLKASGFKELRLSLETANEKIQKLTGDKVSATDLKRAVLLLKEAGFEKNDIGVYILIGTPWLNIEKTKEDVLFVNSLGAKAVLASYSPIPHTKDYTILVESGIIEENLDPIWHNKAVFSEKLLPGLSEEIQSLRRFTSKINT